MEILLGGGSFAAKAGTAGGLVGGFLARIAVEAGAYLVAEGLFNKALGATAPIVAAEGGAGGAANRATFEVYKDSLRAVMERPATSDPRLTSIMGGLYRPNASVGSGSTAAAVRQELLTGQPVGGAFHSQKALDSIRELNKWLERNPTARPGDRAAAENVIRDMQNALAGR